MLLVQNRVLFIFTLLHEVQFPEALSDNTFKPKPSIKTIGMIRRAYRMTYSISKIFFFK